MDNEVTPQELMEDAARIGGWIREFRQLQYEERLLGERFYIEAGPLTKDEDKEMRNIEITQRIRTERPELITRLRFLSDEIEAATARGRLVEMASALRMYV